MVTFLLLVVGGLNWGLEGLGFGLGSYLPSGVEQVVYILIGLSAIYEIVFHKGNCTACFGKDSTKDSTKDAPAGGDGA